MPPTTIDLPTGPLRVLDTGGDGPVVVLLHGALVDGRLWSGVVDALAPAHRCVVPDLPLGAHRLPLRDPSAATPDGVAGIVLALLDALDLDDVTLVGNDTGGAISQLVAAQRPPRLGRLVLTSCDAFDHCPPPMFRPLAWSAHVPGLLRALAAPMRFAPVRRSPLGFGLLTVDPLPDELTADWIAPAQEDPAIRRDLTTLLRAMRPEVTRRAAERLVGFDRAALVAWGARDRVFPVADGRRLAQLLGARFELVPGAGAFVPVDQPARVAELVAGLVAERSRATA
jgi:pimeloyl-ACP methyl ester carboxylesterase